MDFAVHVSWYEKSPVQIHPAIPYCEQAVFYNPVYLGHLDAPVKRVAGTFNPTPYADPLEKVVLPQDDDVLKAAREVLAY
jgi:hypothetical protein